MKYFFEYKHWACKGYEDAANGITKNPGKPKLNVKFGLKEELNILEKRPLRRLFLYFLLYTRTRGGRPPKKIDEFA